MQRVLLVTLRLGRWSFVAGVVLAVVGVLGWILSLFHLPSAFLVDLGLMSLPLFFLGTIFFFVAAILSFILRRRSSTS